MDQKTLNKAIKFLQAIYSQPELWNDSYNEAFKRGYNKAIEDLQTLLSTVEEDEKK